MRAKGKAKPKPGKTNSTDQEGRKESNNKEKEKMRQENAKLKEENDALQKRIKEQDEANDARTETPHTPYLTKLSTFENGNELDAKKKKNSGKRCGCCAKRAPKDPEKARLSQIEKGAAKE